MTVLEDRLRSELRAEADLITPESIVPLRLPGGTERMPEPRVAAVELRDLEAAAA